MLVIRLLRVGKKNQPSFKIVVTEKQNPPKGGRFVEEIGFYNPRTKELVLKKERAKYWMSQGAQPSGTMHNLLVKEGVLEGKKIPVHKKPKKLEEDKSSSHPSPSKEGSEKEEEKEEKPAEEKKEEVKEAKPEGEKKEAEPVSVEPPKEKKKEESLVAKPAEKKIEAKPQSAEPPKEEAKEASPQPEKKEETSKEEGR